MISCVQLPILVRKKKCDEARPRCSDCRRLNIPCRWPSSPSTESESSPADTTALSVSDANPSDEQPLDERPLDQQLLDGTSTSPATFADDPIILPDMTLEETTPLPISWSCLNPHLRSEEDSSLFNHYLNTVARILSRSCDQSSNPFLSTLLPIAAASDTVTSVILGLSGCHWRRVYPTIWNCALARQGRGMPFTRY